MEDKYYLMHKNTICGAATVEREYGTLIKFQPIDSRYTPFLGNADIRLMKIWWKYRAVPGSRKEMEEVIRRSGCDSNMEYLAKNLALSLTDTYWICPAELELSWDDVNLYKHALSENEIVTYHNATSYDPNASLGGQMSKYWDVSGERPILVKKASAYYGQQSINEFFASEVHRRQATDISYVRYYSRDAEDNTILSCCEAFTSDTVEYVTAYEVLRSRKLRNDRSDYDQLIDICEENGINRDVMQRFMDYLVLSDFAISNTDEHLQNFGVIRDADTMELIGPAPIFDSGNIMFYNEMGTRPLSRVDLLERKISSLYTSEEKMLGRVRYRDILDIDKLPLPDEVQEYYHSYGIPEERAEFIAGSYSNKLSLLKDFQSGKDVSLYKDRGR